jgi:hypothetical protein
MGIVRFEQSDWASAAEGLMGRHWVWAVGVAAALAATSANPSGQDTPVVDAFDCSLLPHDLLEQSLYAGESLFKPGGAEQFGWRVWDEEFQDATGLREYEFFVKPESKTISYDRVIYQRLDMDADGKDEIVALAQYPQGRYPTINYELSLFCDSANWQSETCDGSSAGAKASVYGGYRFRRKGGHGQSLGDYSVTDLWKVYQPVAGELGITNYDHGAIINSFGHENYVAVTELFYTDASEESMVYGATIWPLTADSLGTPLFCTWRK